MGKRLPRIRNRFEINVNTTNQGPLDERDKVQIQRAAVRRDELRHEIESALRDALVHASRRPADVVEREARISRLRSRGASLTAAIGRPAFGRLDLVDETRVYIGRTAIAAVDSTPIVVDWRAPAARPYYTATAANPCDVRLRRHLVVDDDRLRGYDDEWLQLGLDHDRPLERDEYDRADVTRHRRAIDGAGTLRTPRASGPDMDTRASGTGRHLLDALSAPRTGRMKDAAATLQFDQDRIIRADRHGVLVVQGAPGTGKTVVALHRVAYLLYENRERFSRSGVLLLGPSRRFLRYVSEVLPALGETAVVPATMGELFPGVVADADDPAAVSAIKGRLAMVEVLVNAVAALQRVPDDDVEMHLGGTPVRLAVDRLRDVRDRARASGLPHELARGIYREELLTLVTDAWARAIGTDPFDGTFWLDDDDLAALRAEVGDADEVRELLDELWPRLTPTGLLRRLWTDPGLLAAAADGLLTGEEQAALRREADGAWTISDVALLDEAAELLGHDDSAARSAEAKTRRADEEYARGVLEVLHGSRALEDDDVDDEIDWNDPARADALAASMLADRFSVEDHRSLAERALADRTWVFDHVVVDEAQELTPMAWRLVVRRCPSRSMTVVGDLAQTTRWPAPRSWSDALEPALTGRWRLVELDVSYRTPEEVLDVAAKVLARSRPDLRAPRALRGSGQPVQLRKSVVDVPAAVSDLIETTVRGLARRGTTAIITPPERVEACRVAAAADVPVLTPRQSKGLEFDEVILVAPEDMAAADLYVAVTRCTSRLSVVTESDRVPWDEPN